MKAILEVRFFWKYTSSGLNNYLEWLAFKQVQISSPWSVGSHIVVGQGNPEDLLKVAREREIVGTGPISKTVYTVNLSKVTKGNPELEKPGDFEKWARKYMDTYLSPYGFVEVRAQEAESFYLEHEGPSAAPAGKRMRIEFPVNEFASAKTYLEMLEKAGCKTSSGAEGVIRSLFPVAVSSFKEFADLQFVSVAQLGFEKGAPLKDVYARAIGLGFGICPPPSVPVFTAQHGTKVSGGEQVVLATHPIQEGSLGFHLFKIKRSEDAVVLKLENGCIDSHHHPDTVFAFIAPAKYA